MPRSLKFNRPGGDFLGEEGDGAAAEAAAGGGGDGCRRRRGGGAAGAGGRDRAGVLAAGLRRPPQLLARVQAMVPRLGGAARGVEKGVHGGLEPVWSLRQAAAAAAMPDLLKLDKNPAKLVFLRSDAPFIPCHAIFTKAKHSR